MIRWTERASADLVSVVEWLDQRNPAAAERLASAVLAAIERLEPHPNLGRRGRAPGTRELVVPRRRNYVVVYRLVAGTVVILRVLHGKMQWPEAAG